MHKRSEVQLYRDAWFVAAQGEATHSLRQLRVQGTMWVGSRVKSVHMAGVQPRVPRTARHS